jgi:hypothetical protein
MSTSRAIRLTVVYVAAVTLFFALWRVPVVSSHLDDRVDEARSIQPEYRSIVPALHLDISRDFVLEARDRVEYGSTYAVLTGSKVAVSNDLVLGAVGGFMPFVLLPRRQVAPDEADWLLCYGCDRSTLPQESRVVWEVEGGGLAIAQRR